MSSTPQSPHLSRKARGFTLIELLVVISIIALLATLSIPIFKMVTSSSNAARSLANLRNIGTVMESFVAENNSKLPAISLEDEDDDPLDWQGLDSELESDEIQQLPNWARVILHHSINSGSDLGRRVFSCPGTGWRDAKGKKLKTEDILIAYGATEAMYGFDDSGALVSTEERSTATIESQPNTILIVETKQEGSEPVSYRKVSWGDARKDFGGEKPQDSKVIDFRFKKAVNCLYADGSAGSFKFKDKKDLEEENWTGQGYDSRR